MIDSAELQPWVIYFTQGQKVSPCLFCCSEPGLLLWLPMCYLWRPSYSNSKASCSFTDRNCSICEQEHQSNTIVQAVGQRAGAVVGSFADLAVFQLCTRTSPGPAAMGIAVAGLGDGILE